MKDYIWQEILAEREKQDAEHGGIANDDKNTLPDWIRHTQRHLLKAAIIPNFRYQMVRVAALAVAAIEWVDRHGGKLD